MNRDEIRRALSHERQHDVYPVRASRAVDVPPHLRGAITPERWATLCRPIKRSVQTENQAYRLPDGDGKS